MADQQRSQVPPVDVSPAVLRTSWWKRPIVIGLLEIAGAIALLTPLFSGLAGLAFVGLMSGAVLTTLLMFGPQLVAMPAAVLVLAAVIAWGRRRSVTRLIALIRHHAQG